ncbi:MAG TPA: multidrug efflux SMR transporter [Steroidobacteraceae bacterium]|nr:multidrug efflux SMR transporter [Steroidobacteraceae bacterium]
MQAWLYLLIAIVAEVVATSALKATAAFTRPGPSVVVIVGYGVAFYFLSRALETVPVGVTYAVWSGVGIVLITLIAWLVYGQALDLAAIVGLALIVAGVVVLNLFSKTVVTH